MRKRFFCILSVALPLVLVSGNAQHAAEKKPGTPSLSVLASLSDPRDQKCIGVSELQAKKAVVVIFLGTECPINNAYLPRLNDLSGEYGKKGVQFVGVNANQHDTAERVAAHAKKNDLKFPLLKDDKGEAAEAFHAQRTPEAFLFDSAGRVRYHGRIDDRFGVGFQRPKATRDDLQIALDEVLAGKDVSTPETTVAGCLIARPKEAKNDAAVTYSKQVARILQNRCQECHRPGMIGPMALLTYDDARAWSATMREVIDEKRMPPWHADPRYGHFSNNRSLSQEERDTLLAWIDQGCAKGSDAELPPSRNWPEGWSIGTPDVVISLPREQEIPAVAPKGGVPYKYISVDPGFTEDKWVVRAEAKGQATSVVHHIIVFVSAPNQQFVPGGPGGRVLVGTAPGDMPAVLPDGMAKKIPKGSKLVFQMHYTPDGIARKDRSSVGLIFAKQPPERQVYTLPVANMALKIPAGDANHQVESSFTFREDSHLIAFMPHMHLRGKDFLYEAIYPDGHRETLLSVPKYDFNWQSVYRLKESLPMPKGTRIHCLAHFDNSDKNPNNPDSTVEARWGEQTWEEMMIGWIDFVNDRKAQ